MAAFRDAKNAAWNIIIDGPAMERVRSQAGSLLLEDIAKGGGKSPQEDPAGWGAMFYAILEPQIRARQLTPALFAQRIAPVFAVAVKAFYEALADTAAKEHRSVLRKAMCDIKIN